MCFTDQLRFELVVAVGVDKIHVGLEMRGISKEPGGGGLTRPWQSTKKYKCLCHD
jgi:hypothetical protein